MKTQWWVIAIAVSLFTGPIPSEARPVEGKPEIIRLKAEDGDSRSRAVFWAAPETAPRTAVLMTHPNSDMTMDWRFPYLVEAGFAGVGLAHRYTKDNANLIMEEVMLDIAAAVRYLKEQKGIRHVVLLGHSGGGSTMTYYQNQAEKKPPHRFSSTPAGDPPDLNAFALPPADGLIVSASHRGRGWVLMQSLDPSVVDESDPLSVDPELDMYNPANGFRTPPEPSKYGEEFLKRYYAAQEARMHRLTEQARGYVREQDRYQEMIKRPDYKDLPRWEQILIERAATSRRYMVIYRVEANPRYTDLSIDPSDRVVGNNRGFRPDLQNYAWDWHPNTIRPRAFLSSQSMAENFYLLKDIAEVQAPTLVICGTADRNEYKTEQQAVFDAAGSKDRKQVWIEGADHSYLPSGPQAGKGDQRDRTMKSIVDWMRGRFASP